MWTYRLIRPKHKDESDSAAIDRLKAEPGVIAVEPMPGYDFFSVYIPARDVTVLDFAKLLIENPEVLPGSVALRWLDEAGDFARHLADDTNELAVAVARAREAAQAEGSARLRALLGGGPFGGGFGKGPQA